MAEDRAFVIVGASLAGAKAAQTLRSEGFEGRVVLVGAEAERPYERPGLSKGYLLDRADRACLDVHPPQWYAENDVDLRLDTEVTSLDLAGQAVTTAGGGQISYDRLLLTTGAAPRRLPVPGGETALYLRTVADSDRLRESFTSDAHVVVVGAGWIGLEAAAAARTHGALVTVVEPAPTPLNAVLGPELGEVFARLHRDNGVDLRCGVGVTEVRPDTVVTTTGQVLPADVVVAGVGVAPRTELAAAAGIAVDNGILVDATLRTSDAAVFAAGDVANAEHPGLGRRARVEHWANALHQGPAAARSMLDRGTPYDRVPYFYTDQYDLGMEYSGYAGAGDYDRVVYRGDVDRREFVAFWLREGRVLAGMNVNVWDITDPIQALVRAGWSGGTVDADRLADSEIPLDAVAAG